MISQFTQNLAHTIFIAKKKMEVPTLIEVLYRAHNHNMRQGKAIWFIAGKYAGRKGWVDDDGKPSASTVAVIVLKKNKTFHSTYVFPESIRLDSDYANPTSHAEAVIDQCPDVKKALVQLCCAVVKCDMQRNTEGFKRVIAQKMDEAVKWQESKGSEAMCRRINHNGNKKMKTWSARNR